MTCLQPIWGAGRWGPSSSPLTSRPPVMSKSKNKPEQASPRPREMPAWPALVGLAAAVSIVYGRALDAPFIFDDSISVLQNRSITVLWPLFGDASQPGPLNPPIENPTSARPLVNLPLAANYRLGQFDP